MIYPFKDFKITTPYSWSFHPALDMVAIGDTAIYSPVNGVVYYTYRFNPNLPLTGNNKGGNFVIIQSSNDNNLWYYFGHLQSIFLNVGQKISQGQQIGRQGSTGYVSGAHLHYEIHKGTTWEKGTPINPETLEDIMPEQWMIDIENKANDTLKFLKMNNWLSKPLSEKLKVLLDIAKNSKDEYEEVKVYRKK